MDDKKVSSELLKIAKSLVSLREFGTVENDNVRITRYTDSAVVTDLTNAGKRGKKCDIISIYELYNIPSDHSEIDVELFIKNLSKAKNFTQAERMIRRFVDFVNPQISSSIKIEERQEKGVDVTPTGFKKLKLKGKYVDIESGNKHFSIRDKVDKMNLPTAMDKGGKRNTAMFYRFVRDNENWLKKAQFEDILRRLNKDGIKYHYYLAMD